MTNVIVNSPSPSKSTKYWSLSFIADNKARFPYPVSLAMWLPYDEALKLQERFMLKTSTYHLYDANNNFVSIHDVSGKYLIEEVHSLFDHLF